MTFYMYLLLKQEQFHNFSVTDYMYFKIDKYSSWCIFWRKKKYLL